MITYISSDYYTIIYKDDEIIAQGDDADGVLGQLLSWMANHFDADEVIYRTVGAKMINDPNNNLFICDTPLEIALGIADE